MRCEMSQDGVLVGVVIWLRVEGRENFVVRFLTVVSDIIFQ